MRCRKQKLRCLGGHPGARCVKANKECNFGKSEPNGAPETAGSGHEKGEEGESSGVVKTRLAHLESSVSNILAGLRTPRAAGGPHSYPALPSGSVPTYPGPSLPPADEPDGYGSLSALPYTNDAIGTLPQVPGSPGSHEVGQVRIGNSPEVNLISPYSHSSLQGVALRVTHDKGMRRMPHRNKGQEAEEELSFL